MSDERFLLSSHLVDERELLPELLIGCRHWRGPASLWQVPEVGANPIWLFAIALVLRCTTRLQKQWPQSFSTATHFLPMHQLSCVSALRGPHICCSVLCCLLPCSVHFLTCSFITCTSHTFSPACMRYHLQQNSVIVENRTDTGTSNN